MKMLRIVLIGMLLLHVLRVSAQDYAESALLFSRTQPAGSARIQALGGAQTSLGGDYSSALSNPAGLGMFNRSEFTFSLGFNSHNTSSSYLGTTADESKSIFNIPGISYVHRTPLKGDFVGGAFGVSYSRTNDFNRSIRYGGFNGNNSIIDYFIDQANGATTSQFDEGADQYNTPTGLAYFNYLIGAQSILKPPGPNNKYFTDAGYPQQEENIEVKGASSQWSFSYGANYKDKLFIGGGVGLASLRYKSQKVFTENFNSDTLQNLRLTENLDIKGIGINATLGAIARPVDFLQIGASFTTPTVYSLTETYDAGMSTRWNNFDYYGDKTKILGDNTNKPVQTDIVTSNYSLTTPLRFSTGITFISKLGFISADVDLVNPAKAKYSAKTSGISYGSENQDIKSLYTSVVNYRLGAEFRYSIWRVRAGYGIMGNTFRDGIDADNKITTVSGGIGIRTKTFYTDLTLVNRSTKNVYHPYSFSDGSGPLVDQKIRSVIGMVTVGFTF